MAEATNVTNQGQQGTGEGQQNDQNQNQNQLQLPTTVEDLQKLLQSETDKRVTQALQTAQQKWETDFSQKIEDAKAEAAKLAKMTQDEKAKFELEKRETLLQQREAEIAKKDLKLATIDILKEKQLPIDFVDFIMTADAETTKANIDGFEKLWQAKLEEVVNDKLKGKTPKAGSEAAAATTSTNFTDVINQNRIRR